MIYQHELLNVVKAQTTQRLREPDYTILIEDA